MHDQHRPRSALKYPQGMFQHKNDYSNPTPTLNPLIGCYGFSLASLHHHAPDIHKIFFLFLHENESCGVATNFSYFSM